MKRRTFLISTAGMAVTLPAISAPSSYAEFLGTGWQMPRATMLEVWPADVRMDLSGMLAAVADWTIPSDSQLIIRLKDGEHVQKQTVAIRHAQGNRLAIVGNRADPGRCKLQWSGPADALYVGSGYVLGMLDGVTIEHTALQARALGSAVLADEGGIIQCGPNVRTRNFYYGFQARIGGVIRCSGTQSEGAGDANYFAFNGGHIIAHQARASGARDEKNKLGSGFVAEYGGTIDAENAIAEYNLLAGFTALSNGSIRANGARAEHNGRAGFYAVTGGRIVAHDGQARANCGQGLLMTDNQNGVSGNKMIDEGNGAAAPTCVR